MLPNIQVGEEFTHPHIYSFAGHSWQKNYLILGMEEPTLRFGKPDRLLRVRCTTINCFTGERRVIDASKPVWLNDITRIF